MHVYVVVYVLVNTSKDPKLDGYVTYRCCVAFAEPALYINMHLKYMVGPMAK